jgi:peptidyl-prolyl cis-trans isomerase SurA
METKKADSSSTANSNMITETHVRHILLKKDNLAPDSTMIRRLVSLRNDIVHKQDFAKVAEENSQDPGSVANGGDLGWIKPGVLDPKFEAAMNKLAVNEISQPIKTQFGWHLIQVLGRRQLQDSKAALQLKAQQMIFQQKLDEAQKQLVSQLRAQAYIKIFNNAN